MPANEIDVGLLRYGSTELGAALSEQAAFLVYSSEGGVMAHIVYAKSELCQKSGE